MMLPERQRRGRHGRGRGLGLRGRVRRRDERRRRRPRARPDELREPDRPRRPGQLLDRGRPRRADARAARGQALPRDRRRARGDPEQRLGASATVVTRNTLLLADPSVDGIKTGHTTRGRLRARRLGQAGGGAARLGRARRGQRGGSRRRDRRAPRLRLLALRASAAPFRGAARSSPRRRSRYEDEPLALVAKRALPVVGPRGPAAATPTVDAPLEVEGPIERGERARHGDGRPSTASGSARSRWSRPRAIAEPTWVDRVGGPGVVVAASSPSRSSYCSLSRSCFGTARRAGRRERSAARRRE